MSEPHPARPGSETTGELLSAYLDSVDAYVDATTSPGGVDDRLRALLDAPPATTLQAQGDVMVLPWPASSAPSYRATEIDAASLVPLGGIPVTADGSHVLIPAEPSAMAPWPRYHPNAKGYTLGTLLVPDGGAARLSHAEHADLLIGPGVYVVRQQRRWESTHAAPAPAGD